MNLSLILMALYMKTIHSYQNDSHRVQLCELDPCGSLTKHVIYDNRKVVSTHFEDLNGSLSQFYNLVGSYVLQTDLF